MPEGLDKSRARIGGAVVFDCDGLLLDTERCWTNAETALFAEYGRAFGLAEKRALIGTSMEAGGRVLERLLEQPGRAAHLTAELQELVLAEVLRGASPLPGAAALVAELSGVRPLAVASNSPRRILDAALEGAGLAGVFDVTLGGDEVSQPKPAPDIYLRACELLAVEPSASVALEDSPTGAAAARAAGLYVVGVPSLPGLELDADLVVESLEHPRVRRALEMQ
jgi:HAD superfamily hydrolase (TIGR01509 family)